MTATNDNDYGVCLAEWDEVAREEPTLQCLIEVLYCCHDELQLAAEIADRLRLEAQALRLANLAADLKQAAAHYARTVAAPAPTVPGGRG